MWNASFKSKMRNLYDDWLANPAGHEYTKGGNLKPPSWYLLCQWIKTCWEEIPTQMVKNSFLSCAITTSTDGTQVLHVNFPNIEGRIVVFKECNTILTPFTGSPCVSHAFVCDLCNDAA